MTEDEMVGWHHLLNGRKFEQTPVDGEGQGSVASCSPWGHKKLDTSERLNNNNEGNTWNYYRSSHEAKLLYEYLIYDRNGTVSHGRRKGLQ